MQRAMFDRMIDALRALAGEHWCVNKVASSTFYQVGPNRRTDRVVLENGVFRRQMTAASRASVVLDAAYTQVQSPRIQHGWLRYVSLQTGLRHSTPLSLLTRLALATAPETRDRLAEKQLVEILGSGLAVRGQQGFPVPTPEGEDALRLLRLARNRE